jgi:hypothetical protein
MWDQKKNDFESEYMTPPRLERQTNHYEESRRGLTMEDLIDNNA